MWNIEVVHLRHQIRGSCLKHYVSPLFLPDYVSNMNHWFSLHSDCCNISHTNKRSKLCRIGKHRQVIPLVPYMKWGRTLDSYCWIDNILMTPYRCGSRGDEMNGGVIWLLEKQSSIPSTCGHYATVETRNSIQLSIYDTFLVYKWILLILDEL